eukprot:190079-Chlamydomonas_euryale.AAC.1
MPPRLNHLRRLPLLAYGSMPPGRFERAPDGGAARRAGPRWWHDCAPVTLPRQSLGAPTDRNASIKRRRWWIPPAARRVRLRVGAPAAAASVIVGGVRCVPCAGHSHLRVSTHRQRGSADGQQATTRALCNARAPYATTSLRTRHPPPIPAAPAHPKARTRARDLAAGRHRVRLDKATPGGKPPHRSGRDIEEAPAAAASS